jgi:hypothetical protein
MITTPLPFNPTIRITFKGFVITRISDGAPSAAIGALADSPCHQPRLEVTQISPDGRPRPVDIGLPESLAEDFSLYVENVEPGVQIYQRDIRPFNRLDDQNDSRDFRWLIDLAEFFNKQITINPNKLKPNFIINSGVFYNNALSPGEVNLKLNPADVAPARFGRYGLEIGFNVYLTPPVGNNPASKAVLKYGDMELFPPVTAADKIRYEIVVNCDCEIDRDESDFPLIFEVIGDSLSPSDKEITLEGHPVRTGSSHTPEVYCGPGNCSTC